jgi:integrase/recombinase XerD
MAELRNRMQRDLERGGYTSATIRHYLRCAQKFVDHFQGRSPMLLGQREIRLFVEHLYTRELSPQRVRQYLAALKFLYGRTLGRPQEVAWIAFPRAKKRTPSILCGSEVARLLVAIENPTLHAIACVCYGAGLRIEEARHLEVRDVLSARGLLHVRNGKGGHQRFAMLSPSLLATLRQYWKTMRPSGPLLFPSRRSGRAFHPDTVRAAIHAAARAAGIDKRVTPHVLRHSFATHLLEMGTEMRVIQQLLGHSSIHSSALYAQVTGALVKRTPSPLDLLSTPQAAILG